LNAHSIPYLTAHLGDQKKAKAMLGMLPDDVQLKYDLDADYQPIKPIERSEDQVLGKRQRSSMSSEMENLVLQVQDN